MSANQRSTAPRLTISAFRNQGRKKILYPVHLEKEKYTDVQENERKGQTLLREQKPNGRGVGRENLGCIGK